MQKYISDLRALIAKMCHQHKWQPGLSTLLEAPAAHLSAPAAPSRAQQQALTAEQQAAQDEADAQQAYYDELDQRQAAYEQASADVTAAR